MRVRVENRIPKSKAVRVRESVLEIRRERLCGRTVRTKERERESANKSKNGQDSRLATRSRRVGYGYAETM